MAKEEEMELETILKETEAPSRVSRKEKPVIRIAKLTGRTISSLKAKINEKRLSRAFKKYNKNYTEMRRALIEANTLKTAQEKGANVTNSEVVEAFDIVASYEKRLAKYGVKLLRDDIKEVVAAKKPRPIRVPRILLGKLRPITKAIMNAVENRRAKKLQKGLEKDIKGATKDFIRDSLDGALFKDSVAGDVRVPVDATVIQGLSVDKKADTFEDKIANLRKFISTDGKTPLFGEEEIGSKEKPVTDVAPVAPVASVEKEDKKLTSEELLSGLGKKPVVEENTPEIETPKTETEPKEKPHSDLTLGDLTKDLSGAGTEVSEVTNEKTVEPVKELESIADDLSDEDKALISKRKREIATIVSLGNIIESLRKQSERITDPQTKEVIENYLQDLNNELSSIVDRSIKRGSSKEEVVEKGDNEQVVHDVIEPIVIEPKQESVKPLTPEKTTSFTLKDGREVKVRVKKAEETIRAEQISTPATLSVASTDVNKLVSRFEAADSRTKALRQEKEELVREKEKLLRNIEEKTLAAERRAEDMASENAELRGEVASLSQIDSSLGSRSK